MKEWLKLGADALSLVVKMALGLGVLVTLGYCWLVIGYFPVGITIGDSLFFFAVAFAYGVVHLATWGLAPAVTVDGLLRLAALRLPKLRDAVYYPAVAVDNKLQFDHLCLALGMGWLSFGGFYLLAKTVWVTGEWLAGLAVVVSGAALWLASLVLKSRRMTVEDRRRAIAACTAVALVVMPLALGQALVRWQVELVMNSYGLRAQNVTLRLSDDNHATMLAAAQSWGLPSPSCDALSGPGSHVVQGVDLAWHGLGERSLALLANSKDKTMVAVELKRDGMFAMRGPAQRPATCPLAVPTQFR